MKDRDDAPQHNEAWNENVKALVLSVGRGTSGDDNGLYLQPLHGERRDISAAMYEMYVVVRASENCFDVILGLQACGLCVAKVCTVQKDRK